MIARRAAILVLVIVLLLVLQRQVRGPIRTWYANTFFTRVTLDVATETPDHILLTWHDDPATTQAINWRTATGVTEAWVEYRLAGEASDPVRVDAAFSVLEDHLLKNDPEVHRFTAAIEELTPSTRYEYRVVTANGTASPWHTFQTGPAEAAPFSFIYFGDAQLGLDFWGDLVQAAWGAHPETDFMLIAGDLVNEGRWRNEWDEFFRGGEGVFDHIPLMPCIGNHDVDPRNRATNYLLSFHLPENGPPTIEPQRAYHFTYGNALFVILDSMSDPRDQSAWLDEVLAASDATWKFVMFHHPVYSSSHRRDNPVIRREWAPIFERHGVDFALQGHDHAYLRTEPLRDGAPAEDGVIYVISVAGTKYYSTQRVYDFETVAFPDTSTYQSISIETNPDRLVYRAFEIDGTLRDEVIIEK